MALFRSPECPDCGEPRERGHVCEPEWDHGPLELADGIWRDDCTYLVSTPRMLATAEKLGVGADVRRVLDALIQHALDAEGVPQLPPTELTEVA